MAESPEPDGERRQVLATIGYEGASTERFLAALQAAGVTAVLDIREVPWSRRTDFAKSRLGQALAERGIAYLHRKALGTPKPGREAAKAGDRESFEKILGEQLDSAEGQEALAEAAALARQGGLCLLCYEHDPAQCHRSEVAVRLAALAPLAIRHLDPLAGPDQRS
ncbi:MAG TPA: DUF488 domain-containing protein [Hypericibacter adhaerens]|jgi:uncharacterized protein (DUF488 family)|uniref:DUF488 domain-containing protein n=1 Tax=Hypericibacter adhaerens TaxID=2602016 RepID=UPI002CC7FFA8|nr:DUF488 domain-containing protein [Hypericibacter adhaerens]HWA45274.1 DUF488 domain-containing protein [Hypericibacter adhaerens]